MRGRVSHYSQVPYHPTYGFEACFMVFLIETNTELCAVCLIAKKDMPFVFSCRPGVLRLRHEIFRLRGIQFCCKTHFVPQDSPTAP